MAKRGKSDCISDHNKKAEELIWCDAVCRESVDLLGSLDRRDLQVPQDPAVTEENPGHPDLPDQADPEENQACHVTRPFQNEI